MSEESEMAADLRRIVELLDDGRAAFGRADFAEAERICREAKELAPEGEPRNAARLHLAVVYSTQFVPNVPGGNLAWLDRAEREYREVLANNPTPEQRDRAERNLKAVKTLRQFDKPLTW